MIAKIALDTLGAKGYDLANADARIMSQHHTWLRQRVAAGRMNESYAGHIGIA